MKRRRRAGLRPDPRPCIRTIDFFTVTTRKTEYQELADLGLPTEFGGRKRAAVQNAVASKTKKKKGGSCEPVFHDLPHLEYTVDEQDGLVNHVWKYSIAKLRQEPALMAHSDVEEKEEGFEKSGMLVDGPNGEQIRVLPKYWHQRESLFSRYDEGCLLDEEAWYSVTPEVIAVHQANKLAASTVVDAFAGVGGNSIQLALSGAQVFAIELNEERLELAKHNSEIYGATIQWSANDCLALLPFLNVDWIFGSSPWGGPSYSALQWFDPRQMPIDLARWIELAWRSCKRGICLFMPRNTHLPTIARMMPADGKLEVELHQMNGRDKAITLYLYKKC